MVFQIRKRDDAGKTQPSVDPFSSDTLVAPDGTIRYLSHDDFRIDVDDTRRSLRSAATYSTRWTVTVPTTEPTLEIEPYLADQELDVSQASSPATPI
jgi:predicted secreted hydrolase